MLGLGCSTFALSSSGSGGVSAFLDSVFVPDTAALPVRYGLSMLTLQWV